jgi:Cdc6-like AAA superfamily ATPase
VIVAGYTEPMKQFFESNPGLKSRFNTFIEFDDYDVEELMDILKNMSNAEDYVVTDKAREILFQHIVKVIDSRRNDFANGRFVRNLFETMTMNHARRVAQIEHPSISDLKELTEKDIPMNI